MGIVGALVGGLVGEGVGVHGDVAVVCCARCCCRRRGDFFWNRLRLCFLKRCISVERFRGDVGVGGGGCGC